MRSNVSILCLYEERLPENCTKTRQKGAKVRGQKGRREENEQGREKQRREERRREGRGGEK